MRQMIKSSSTLESLKAHYAHMGIELLLELKPVKNVNFRYHHPQLRVSAPRHISADQLKALVLQKSDWAYALHQKNQSLTPQQVKGVFSDDLMLGDRVRFWGQSPVLVKQASTQPHNLGLAGCHELVVDWGAQSQLVELYREQLKISLSGKLDERISYWSDVTGLKPFRTRIKLMRSRWGSCNQRTGSISISLAIAMYDPECLDALIVHELCHLKHANHGRHFWELVHHYLPNYREIHSRLR